MFFKLDEPVKWNFGKSISLEEAIAIDNIKKADRKIVDLFEDWDWELQRDMQLNRIKKKLLHEQMMNDTDQIKTITEVMLHLIKLKRNPAPPPVSRNALESYLYLLGYLKNIILESHEN